MLCLYIYILQKIKYQSISFKIKKKGAEKSCIASLETFLNEVRNSLGEAGEWYASGFLEFCIARGYTISVIEPSNKEILVIEDHKRRGFF